MKRRLASSGHQNNHPYMQIRLQYINSGERMLVEE
jgi:hypothetical protein